MDQTTAPSPAPSCPVLNCPWQETEDDKLEGHLYDAHSARVLASTLTTMLASFETQAAIANGLLNEIAEHRDQVLTEAADHLLAARTTQESRTAECPGNPGGDHMHKPAALKAGHWCAYCGIPKPAAVQGA